MLVGGAHHDSRYGNECLCLILCEVLYLLRFIMVPITIHTTPRYVPLFDREKKGEKEKTPYSKSESIVSKRLTLTAPFGYHPYQLN